MTTSLLLQFDSAGTSKQNEIQTFQLSRYISASRYLVSNDPRMQPDAPLTTIAGRPELAQPRRRWWLALLELDVYTWMLIMAFLFVGVSCVLLWLELGRYEFQIRPLRY